METIEQNKLFLSNHGTTGKIMALGVMGDRKFRRTIENQLVNYGGIGTRAQFHQLYDNFGYYVIDLDNFKSGLIDYYRVKYWIDNRESLSWEDILDGAGKYYYTSGANKFYNSIVIEDFMRMKKGKDVHFYYSGLKYES